MDTGAAPDEPAARILQNLETDYRKVVAALAADAASAPRPGHYAEVALRDLVSNWHLGPMRAASPADLFGHPHMGARVRVTGRLKYDEPEGNRLTTAPRFHTLYRIENHGTGDRMWRVSLDLDGVSPDKRHIVERFCTGAVACGVTVHGRIGEVGAERVVILFSPKREFTAMIGMVVEDLTFDDTVP